MCSTVTKHFNRRSHRNHRALHAAMTYGFFQSLDKPHTRVSRANLLYPKSVAVMFVDERVGFGRVFGAHLDGVPFDPLLEARGEVAH